MRSQSPGSVACLLPLEKKTAQECVAVYKGRILIVAVVIL